jgi:hypothetical protein
VYRATGSAARIAPSPFPGDSHGAQDKRLAL